MNQDLDTENSDYRDVGNYNFVNDLTKLLHSKVISLVDLAEQHQQLQMLPSKERYVITDGTVCNMNMTPFGNGNRIINLTDLTSEFEYGQEGNITTCWMPSNINIDFGIGSNVIVIGRTSQRMGDDGPEAITINVSGVYVVEQVGAPAESTEEENDFDWF